MYNCIEILLLLLLLMCCLYIGDCQGHFQDVMTSMLTCAHPRFGDLVVPMLQKLVVLACG
jgi:hypothetical protein